MMTFDQENDRIIGTDNQGSRHILFDFSDLYKNKGRIPIWTLGKPADSVEVHNVIRESIYNRFQLYLDELGKKEKAVMFQTMDFLMADKFISASRPYRIALMDLDKQDVRIVSDSILGFNKFHRIYLIDSAGHDVYRKQGFDIVIIKAEDKNAEQQLRAAAYLMADDGLLLAVSENTIVFYSMLELFFNGTDRMEINDEYSIFKVYGRDNLRPCFEDDTLYLQYMDLCGKIRDCLESGDPPTVLRKYLFTVNRSVNNRSKTKQKSR